MRINRRRCLAISGALAAGGVGGCMGLLDDNGLSFEADPAVVAEGTIAETGYEEASIDSLEIERTFEAAGQSRTVRVTNWQAEYQKAVDIGPLGEHRAALFAVLSSPEVDVLGRSFNPIADMSTDELVDYVQDQYAGLKDLSRDRDGDVTILGEETTQTRFSGEATVADGAEVDVYLHLTEAVESGEDLVITVGGYPQRRSDEEDHILAMMAGVEHESS